MQLTLTPEVENALSAQALLQGISPEQLALDALRERFLTDKLEQKEWQPQETLLDFLDGFIGVLNSKSMHGKAGMSAETGKAFTRILTEKRAQGRL